ncbi:uncharacterized protein FA14DRAFT_7625 [Meira miltonrushii]|uniref:Ams2/SPT21 N-terminal domain-containing protein n=1 Tax=Meira miltonrushii TaxID=1280837 RepID=A0A316VH81_9BASI|nr:uncharacterized protein FA14DRAFT_7625 [Meira miltonrushii]PWN36880.1 hypothetical protein FA14DRAFT_7625 [Meira miltonrushii]
MSQHTRMPMRHFDGQMDIFGSILSPASSFIPPSSSPLPGQSPSNNTQQNNNNTMSQPKRIRRGARRVNMPIKILYNLDSNPDATMVAQIEQRMPVDVLPIKRRTNNNNKDGNGTPVFARVPLKVCLQGICMASPELLSSTTKDYVLYAVDPVEAHRANMRREVTSNSSGSQEASPLRGKNLRSSAAFMVGKGYMSQALTQEGMGVATVHGRVRGEFDDEDEEDEEVTAEDEDDEEFWDSRVLEVSLKLNVSSPPEITLMEKAKQETRTDSQTGLPTTSKAPLKRSLTTPAEPLQALSSNQIAEEASAEAPPAASKGQSSKKPGPQRQLLHLLQALQAQAQQGSSSSGQALPVEIESLATEHDSGDQKKTARSSKNNRIRFSSPSPSSSATTSLHPNGAQSSPVMANQKHWPSTSKRPKARASASSYSDAQSPILGGLTPGYEVDYLSGPSPSSNADGNQLTGSARADVPKIAGRGNKVPESQIYSSSKNEQCYNCGLKGELYWRYLNISDEAQVRFYDSSVCVYNGIKSFRSCNACGTYFARYRGVSRPDFVIKEHEAKRLEKLKQITSHNTSSASSEDDNEEKTKRKSAKSAKRKSSAFSRTLSEACAIDSKRMTDDPEKGKGKAQEKASKTKEDEEQSEPKQNKVKRRKLSHSDKEEAKKSQPQERKFVEDFEKARLRDLVLDQDGNWRSKRSILENPTNRRVGRPPGRKTGCGLGRQRNTESARVAAAALKEDLMNARENGSQAVGSATDPMPEVDLTDESAVADALQAILSSSSPVRPAHANQLVGGPAMQHPSFALPYAPNQMMHHHHHHQKMPHSTPGRSFSHQSKTPMSVSRVRYGAPAHLMMSSPATAFQTVMDEADTDWKALFGIGNSATRRSPRKKPAGVHGGINPYATNLASPSRLPMQRHGVENPHHSSVMDPDILMQMTSSSPLTRSRVKSGQFEWAFNSSDDAGTQKKKVSSAITSPTSPSPTRTRILSSKRKANPNEVMLEAGPISSQSTSRKNQATKQAKLAKEQELNSFDNEPFAGYTAINVSGLDQDDEDHIDDDEGPGSPTLGRSRRLDKKKKNAEMRSTPTANGLFSSTPSDLGNNVDLGGSQAEWQQNATIPELFPSTSPEKGWNVVSNGSPSQMLWNSPSSWALRMPTPSPIKVTKQTSESFQASTATAKQADTSATSAPSLSVTAAPQEEKKSPSTSLAPPVQKRKPLPATVEDASPSEASNPSPNDDDEDDEEEEVTAGENGEMVIDMTDGDSLAALMQIFEDPYGLLAASGINLPAVPQAHKSTGIEQTSKDNASNATTENNLAHIELFKSFDYAKELGFFNQAGASGIAANAGPSAPTTVETGSSSKGTNDPAMADVKNMLTSPHKIEIDGNFLRISPRKKTASQSSQPVSTNSEINFGDWIWSDVQKTPTKQSAA